MSQPRQPFPKYPGLNPHLGVLAHLRALENATIFTLQKALQDQQPAPKALLKAFEPGKYVLQTLGSLKTFVEDYVGIESTRVAIFVPDIDRRRLHLFASVADKERKHRTNLIELSERSIAAQVFQSGKPLVWQDTSQNDAVRGTFNFFRKEQHLDIASHFSLPILERKLVTLENEPLPIPSDNPWGSAQGVLCLDSAAKDAFAMFAEDDGEAISNLLDPLTADLYLGLLLSSLKGWNGQ